MSAQILTKDDIVAMLTWQHEMGVDEAILDQPGPAMTLDTLLHGAAAVETPALPARVAEGVIAGAGAAPASNSESAASDSATATAPPAAPGSSHLNWAEAAAGLGIDTLQDLRNGLAAMEHCALKHTASNLCFADGNAGARLMIIGEVPGRDEDRMGVPFVGAPGHLLDRMLACIGLDRSGAYLTPLLPWRPPGNRTPTDEEIALLLPWLYRHIQLANPEVILLLGGAAAKLVFTAKDGILKLRGRWHDIDFGDGVKRPVLASLHPSYLIRSPAQKRLAFDDLLCLAARLVDDAGQNKT